MKLIALVKEGVDRFTSAIDDLFSGGVPFTPIPPPFGPGAVREYEGMRAQQDFAYRASLAGQGAMMGGFGGPLLEQLMGYRPYEVKPKSTLEEGKVSVQVAFKRIDKEHVLVQVECIQRIVHNKKELREVTADLIEQYAEGYVFGEQPKMVADPADKEPRPEPKTNRPDGAMQEVSKK